MWVIIRVWVYGYCKEDCLQVSISGYGFRATEKGLFADQYWLLWVYNNFKRACLRVIIGGFGFMGSLVKFGSVLGQLSWGRVSKVSLVSLGSDRVSFGSVK